MKCDTPFEMCSDLCDLFNEIFKTGNWGVTLVANIPPPIPAPQMQNYQPQRPPPYYPPLYQQPYPQNPQQFFQQPYYPQPPCPQAPQQQNRPRKTFFPPIPMPYRDLLPSVLARGLVQTKPPPRVPNPIPNWYRADRTCDFHQGAPRHDIENCFSFMDAVQKLIESGDLSFTDNHQNNSQIIKQVISIR